MDNETLLNAILESLANSSTMTLNDFAVFLPVEEMKLLGFLGKLKSMGVLDKRGSGKSAEYEIAKNIGSYHLAKLAEAGADFGSLPKWLGLKKAEVEAGLALSTEIARLKEMEEARLKEKARESEEKLLATKRDEVSETLEMVLSATREAREKEEKKKKRNEDVLNSLKKAEAEAERALKEYKKSLLKRSKNSWSSNAWEEE